MKRRKRPATASRSARTSAARLGPDTSRPATATRLLSETDREAIRAGLLADRAAYATIAHPDAAAALGLVEQALLRLDTPDYGYCAVCGVRIATPRLLELPHTEHCLPCSAETGRRHPRRAA